MERNFEERSATNALGRTSWSRRRLLRVGGGGLLGAALLGACRTSGDDVTTNTTAAPSGTGQAPDSAFLNELFGAGGEAAGAGLTINAGAGLLLSTSQAYYGQQSLKGINLAIKQIQEAGGPTFRFDAKDLSLTPTAPADISRAWGEAGIRMGLAAGFFGTGGMLPAAEQYKMTLLDPGGGTSTVFQGMPFAWGLRAITPNDAFPGVAQYLKQKMPEAKRWVFMSYDLGPLTTGMIESLSAQAKSVGAEVVGSALVSQPGQGSPDYQGAVSQIRQMDPDVVFGIVWGSDPATLMKAYSTVGLDAPVIGPDFSASTIDVAGGAFDGYHFAYDYFDANNPGNPWGKFFVESFRAEYRGETPDYYPANYYEDTFILWELVKRVLAKGGDINNGDDIDAAMRQELRFKSVYGKGEQSGTVALDGNTHTVTQRPMGLFRLDGETPTPLAYYDIGGKGFRLA